MVLDESVMRRSNALRETMSFARAILADGEVSDSEATGFKHWLAANSDVIGLPAIDEIVGVLENIFSDGHISESERRHLVELLERFGG